MIFIWCQPEIDTLKVAKFYLDLWQISVVILISLFFSFQSWIRLYSFWAQVPSGRSSIVGQPDQPFCKTSNKPFRNFIPIMFLGSLSVRAVFPQDLWEHLITTSFLRYNQTRFPGTLAACACLWLLYSCCLYGYLIS